MAAWTHEAAVGLIDIHELPRHVDAPGARVVATFRDELKVVVLRAGACAGDVAVDALPAVPTLIAEEAAGIVARARSLHPGQPS